MSPEGSPPSLPFEYLASYGARMPCSTARASDSAGIALEPLAHKAAIDLASRLASKLPTRLQDPARSESVVAGNLQAAHLKLLTQFQDPAQADQLTRIMTELEQTKVVLHETIEAALERRAELHTHSRGHAARYVAEM